MIPAFDATTSRTIKIFISSTFQDMKAERDIIVNSIFPRLRDAFRKRLADIVEVDLRWGITEEMAEHGRVLEICIGEVLRCAPFFVGLIGDRYGSPARPNEIDSLPENYKKVLGENIQEGVSITELEMRAGAFYPRKNSCACFYLKPNFQADEGDETQRKLAELRNYISSTQIYSVYTSLHELEELLYNALKNYIEREIPDDPTIPYGDRTYFSHLNVLKANTLKHVPNYGQARRFQQIYRTQHKLYLYGEKGSGKTGCLSDLIRREGVSENGDVFFHFVTAGNDNGHMDIAFYRLWLYICSLAKNDITVVNGDYESAVRSYLSSTELERPVTLFFDAVEQFDDQTAVFKLFSLADINPKIRIVCAGTIQYRHLEKISATVKPLSSQQIEKITRKQLKKFGKTLDEEDYNALRHNNLCRNPLFLNVLISQLRMYGTYESLQEFFQQLLSTQDVAGLLEIILRKLEAYYTRYSFPAEKLWEALAALVCSYDGLSETELQNMLQLPTLMWRILYSTIENFLIEHDGLLKFNHDLIVNALKNQLTDWNGDYERMAREKLICYFSGNSHRGQRELAYQFRKCLDNDALVSLLAENNCFVNLAKTDGNLLISCLSVLTKQQQQLAEAVIKVAKPIDVPSIADAFCRSGCFFACIRVAEEMKDQLSDRLCYFEVMDQYARAVYKLGRNQFRDAIRVYEELCTAYNQTFPDDIIGYVSRYFLQGVAYNSAGYIDKALEIFHYCTNQFTKNHVYTTQAAWAMDNLGCSYFKQGQLSTAKKVGNQAIEICIRLCGELSPETAWAYCYAWPALFDSGEFEQALKMMHDAYTIYGTLYMNSGVQFAWAANNYGSAKAIEGAYQEAVDLYQISIELNNQTTNDEQRPHVYSLTSYNNIASVLCLDGQQERALDVARFTVAQSVKKNGSEHIYTINFLLNLGIISKDLALIEQAIAAYERIGKDLLDLSFARLMRARLIRRSGGKVRTEELLQNSITSEENLSLLGYLNSEEMAAAGVCKASWHTTKFSKYRLYLTHSNNSCMLVIPEA